MNDKKEIKVFTVSDEKNENVKSKVESDYIEESIGTVGYWQVGICILAVLPRYIVMANMTGIVFLTPMTTFVCHEFKDNKTIEAQNDTCYESCSRYVFHSEVMETTLISDFELICEKAWLKSFTQSVLMFGLTLGAIFFGWLSDRYGRRPAIISASLLNVISMIPTSFAPDYWTFTALRFISGFASGGSFIVCVPIFMEIIGKVYREQAGAIINLPDGISQASLALFAYFLPKWNNYLLGLSISGVVILILVFFIPESPRWLISNGKVGQAVEMLERVAKFNKLSTEHIQDTVIRNVEAMSIKENETVVANYFDFFKYLGITTTSVLIVWTVIGTTYYGIYQYMTLLDLNVFTIVAIMGLLQVVLCPITIVVNKLFSRKTTIFGTLLVTAVMMLLLIFTPTDHWTTTLLGVIGFGSSSVSFIVLYVYISELYPTPLRSMAYGITSAIAKVGAMVAPFIANMTPVWVPSVIFAVLSFVAAISIYILPETKGRNLKDTID